mmetsp:Transcript_2597/g.3956  ORF Transcript_2597/g.3956 Transcript_2597/m.3956 type:complete len:176 (+) Transcript_2597:501-1028(+)
MKLTDLTSGKTSKRKTDPLELWLLIEDTHKVNSISKVEEVTKLAARTTYNSIRQGPYESIIAFKERFNSAHESYVAQDNPKHEDKDSAMDFFRALDNARYGTFKTDLMNSMTSKSVEAPENLNAMYVIALQWLNPSTKPYPNGFATTFATALDIQDKPSVECDARQYLWRLGCYA